MGVAPSVIITAYDSIPTKLLNPANIFYGSYYKPSINATAGMGDNVASSDGEKGRLVWFQAGAHADDSKTVLTAPVPVKGITVPIPIELEPDDDWMTWLTYFALIPHKTKANGKYDSVLIEVYDGPTENQGKDSGFWNDYHRTDTDGRIIDQEEWESDPLPYRSINTEVILQ